MVWKLKSAVFLDSSGKNRWLTKQMKSNGPKLFWWPSQHINDDSCKFCTQNSIPSLSYKQKHKSKFEIYDSSSCQDLKN